MAQFEPYLCFPGTCAEALAFYEQALGATTEFRMTFADAPPDSGMPPVGDADRGRILHASITLDGHRLMASDVPPGMPHEPMQGVTVSLSYPTADAGRRVFDRLAEGGRVTMAWGRTFWADGFGMVVDRFGTPWMVNAGDPGTGPGAGT